MMTTHKKLRMGVSITLLVLSVAFAIVFAVVTAAYHTLETPEPEAEGPLVDVGVEIYSFALAASFLYVMLLLCAAGLVLALGATLVGFNLPLRLCGGGGIALHTGLLIYYFVTYGETLAALAQGA